MRSTRADDSSCLFDLQGVRFGYHPNHPVIHDFTAQLPSGRLCTLLGPNAAGKSTLLRLMLGQFRPSVGSIRLDGNEMANIDPSQRAAKVSYVPQQGGTTFSFTAEQVVRMGRYALSAAPEAVEQAIEETELSALRHRVYAELSAGQQQRVLLARAIAQASGTGRVILLDEPTSALDLRHVHRVMQLLRKLTQTGLAIVVVMHDLNLAARYTDLVWLINQGRMVARGPWHSVLTPDILEPVYQMGIEPVAMDPHQRPMFRPHQ